MNPDAVMQLLEKLNRQSEIILRHLIDSYRANSLTDALARGKIGELSVIDALRADCLRQVKAHKTEVAKHLLSGELNGRS